MVAQFVLAVGERLDLSEQLYQRRFSRPVDSHQSNAVAALDEEAHVAEDFFRGLGSAKRCACGHALADKRVPLLRTLPVRLPNSVELCYDPATWLRLRKREMDRFLFLSSEMYPADGKWLEL